ncbi:hypothetical protein K474DRAFT_223142 [Panus rudis PR-1116 ss-1]|nr:hypothetical protein K474DRAFT_223142 [Panus rudis PR-1116 ss-1]
MSSEERTTKLANAPFDNPDADIILRTSDNVDFRVTKAILENVSPFFADMFSMPQPHSSPGMAQPDTPQVERAPVIGVEEDAETLDPLLRFAYQQSPDVDSLDKVAKVLRSAMKYDIELAAAPMKQKLVELASDQPQAVYATACRLRLEPEAQAAAQILRDIYRRMICTTCERHFDPFSLFHSFFQAAIETYSEDLANIPAGCFHRLIDFVGSAHDKKVVLVEPPPPPNYYVVPPSWPWPNNHPLFTHCKHDLILQSKQDNTQIPVHRIVLHLASASEIVQLPSDGTLEDVPVIHLPESGRVLRGLVMLCYDCDMSRISLKWINELAHAAKKYNISTATARLRTLWSTRMSKDPVLAFFIAASFGWVSEAEKAAKYLYATCRPKATEYTLDMDSYATAATYFSLVKFIYDCAEKDAKRMSLGDPSLFLAPASWNRRHVEIFLASTPTVIEEYSRSLGPRKHWQWAEITEWQRLFSMRRMRRTHKIDEEYCQCERSAEDPRFEHLAAFAATVQFRDEYYYTEAFSE